MVEKGEAGLAGAISQALNRVVYVEGDFVIREGEVNESMHFVEKGLVDVLQLSQSEQVNRCESHTLRPVVCNHHLFYNTRGRTTLPPTTL